MAFDSRQDHANGTLTVRPSTSSKAMRSSAADTAFTRGSIQIAALMPCLDDLDQIGTNLIAYDSEFVRGKTMVGAQVDSLQSEFAYHALSANMDVQGFIAVEAVKEEPVWDF